MQKINFVILLLGWMTNSFLFGDTVSRSISGLVLDEETNEAVHGAVIRIKNTNIWTLTDTHGHFQLPIPLQDTMVQVQVHHIGYEDEFLVCQPNYSQVIRLKIKLNLFEQAIIQAQYTGVRGLSIPVFIPEDAYKQATAKQDTVRQPQLRGWRYWKRIVE